MILVGIFAALHVVMLTAPRVTDGKSITRTILPARRPTMYTPGGNGMAIRGLDELPERVERVEQKLDNLATTVNALAVSVDARFDAVFTEQRELAIHVLETLRKEMDARFAQVDGRFAQVGARFEQMDARFEQMDARFEQMGRRTDGRFDRIEGRFDRLERKLDQFIDVQLQHNALVERRLSHLENRP